MNVAIIGSREFEDYDLLKEVMQREIVDFEHITAIVSGGAKGADSLGAKFADEIEKPLHLFRPDYKKFDRDAPFVRNTEIIEDSDLVVAFWNGKSNGTRDALNKAEKLKKKITIFRYDINEVFKL